MEAVSSIRPGFLGVLLVVVRLSVLPVQNWAYLYNFLLLKIILFNHWLSGWPSRPTPHPRADGLPLGQVLQAGLALQVPRLLWVGTLGCAQALCQAPQWLGAWECLGLSLATWKDLLLSCLHSLILLVLLLLLMIWRLCWKAHHCGSGWLPSKNRVVLEPLAQLKHLYWRVESMTVLISCHLAYLVTWPTCLASHLLQAAFEPTAQLVQTQEAELQRPQGPCPSSQRLGQSCQSTEPLGNKCVPIAFSGLSVPRDLGEVGS
ncbi:transmembrane protein 270 [Manis javanica]|uniref:transmembrane protein 270 n=1 Tax=Manis javanica TaxID=9974 RepID=UPI003C6DA8F2